MRLGIVLFVLTALAVEAKRPRWRDYRRIRVNSAELENMDSIHAPRDVDELNRSIKKVKLHRHRDENQILERAQPVQLEGMDQDVIFIPHPLQDRDQDVTDLHSPDLSFEQSNEVEASESRDQPESKYLRTPCLKRSGLVREHRTYPRSFEHAGFEASLPREWDWRNVNGVNFCSPNRNQHIPVYCGSCWVFGSLGALNDRFNIARKNRWPMTMLSPQEIIDCNGHGSCNGGEVADVYGHAKINGLVEEGCNNYKAVNGKCDPFHRCGTCWPDRCDPVQNFTKYYVKDYGKLSGRLNMMAEIHNRGPIACSIGATPSFEFNYTAGIFNEFSDLPSNHIVSVSGWGYDNVTKTEYWIVRNSWGDAFGELGWFRVVTSVFMNGRGDLYNMGIERECYFADPDVSNLNF